MIEFLRQLQWQIETKPSVRYLIYRALLATYFVFVFVLSLFTAEGCKQLSWYAIYLTNWNVVLNAVTAVFGAVVVALYYKRRIRFDDETKVMPSSFKAYWLLSLLSCCVSISLSLVYWPLIYDGRDKGVNDALTHAGNALVWFVDLFVIAHPPRFGHFVYPLGFGVFYAYLFSLPYTLLGGTDRDFHNFIYSVIDWRGKTTGALAFSFAIIVFLTVMHFVLNGFATLRIKIHQRLRMQ